MCIRDRINGTPYSGGGGGGNGSPDQWSVYPATQTVNFASFDIIDLTAINTTNFQLGVIDTLNLSAGSNLYCNGPNNLVFTSDNMNFYSNIRTDIIAYDFYYTGSNYLQFVAGDIFNLSAGGNGYIGAANLNIGAPANLLLGGPNLILGANELTRIYSNVFTAEGTSRIDFTAPAINLNGSLAINSVPYFPLFTANVLSTPCNITLTSNQKDRLYILDGSGTATFSYSLDQADAGFFVNLKNGNVSNITLEGVSGITTLYAPLPDTNSGMVTVLWNGTSLTAY